MCPFLLVSFLFSALFNSLLSFFLLFFLFLFLFQTFDLFIRQFPLGSSFLSCREVNDRARERRLCVRSRVLDRSMEVQLVTRSNRSVFVLFPRVGICTVIHLFLLDFARLNSDKRSRYFRIQKCSLSSSSSFFLFSAPTGTLLIDFYDRMT